MVDLDTRPERTDRIIRSAALPASGTICVKISKPASTATGTATTVAHRAALRVVRSGAGG